MRVERFVYTFKAVEFPFNSTQIFFLLYSSSIAALHGLCRHDEIMVINGALVQELDMMFIESVLQEELSLSLMIR